MSPVATALGNWSSDMNYYTVRYKLKNDKDDFYVGKVNQTTDDVMAYLEASRRNYISELDVYYQVCRVEDNES